MFVHVYNKSNISARLLKIPKKEHLRKSAIWFGEITYWAL